jgi:hypothetical protein
MVDRHAKPCAARPLHHLKGVRLAETYLFR